MTNILNTSNISSIQKIDKNPPYENVNTYRKFILSKLERWNEENLWFIEEIGRWIKEKELQKWMTKNDISNIFKRLFTKFSVPWIINKSGELTRQTSLDAKACLFLLEKAWFNLDKIHYKKHINHYEEAFVNLDMWWEFDWLQIKWYEWKWLKSFFSNSSIIANHFERKISSTTRIVFELLNLLDLFKNEELEQIKRFVQFIDLLDWAWFEIYWINTDKTKIYPNSYRTLFWLAKFLDINLIYSYFKDDETWFELLSNEIMGNVPIKKYNGNIGKLLDISNDKKWLIRKSILDIEKTISEWDIFKYRNQNLDFVLDVNQNISNWLEVATFYNKWLIKIQSNWGIFIYNPKGFSKKFEWIWAKEWTKICVIKRGADAYQKKLENLMNMLDNKKLKIKFLKYINYEWKVLDNLCDESKKIIAKTKRDTEKAILKLRRDEEKKVTKKLKKREWRKNRSKKNFEKQKLSLDNIKVWMIIKWKILHINKKQRIFVNIKLDDSDWWKAYTTPTRVKSKDHTIRKILDNKEIVKLNEKEEIIYSFVVRDISEESKLISLKQI